jgi:hypothetical protein
MVFLCWDSEWRHDEDEPHQGGMLQEFIRIFLHLFWHFDVTFDLDSQPKSPLNSS